MREISEYVGYWTESGCKIHDGVELMYDDMNEFYYCPLCEK